VLGAKPEEADYLLTEKGFEVATVEWPKHARSRAGWMDYCRKLKAKHRTYKRYGLIDQITAFNDWLDEMCARWALAHAIIHEYFEMYEGYLPVARDDALFTRMSNKWNQAGCPTKIPSQGGLVWPPQDEEEDPPPGPPPRALKAPSGGKMVTFVEPPPGPPAPQPPPPAPHAGDGGEWAILQPLMEILAEPPTDGEGWRSRIVDLVQNASGTGAKAGAATSNREKQKKKAEARRARREDAEEAAPPAPVPPPPPAPPSPAEPDQPPETAAAAEAPQGDSTAASDAEGGWQKVEPRRSGAGRWKLVKEALGYITQARWANMSSSERAAVAGIRAKRAAEARSAAPAEAAGAPAATEGTNKKRRRDSPRAATPGHARRHSSTTPEAVAAQAPVPEPPRPDVPAKVKKE
jgi:hypothetical protein